MKKTIITLLGLVYSVILLSQTAIEPIPFHGVSSSNPGSSSNPYLIESLGNLYWMSVYGNEYDCYRQTADIDASETITWNIGDHDGDPNTPDEPMGWEPIELYHGTYLGQDFRIFNLYINRPTLSPVGFIGL